MKFFVARLDVGPFDHTYSLAQMDTHENRAFARVSREGEPGVLYYIVTLAKPMSSCNGNISVKRQLMKNQIQTTIHWILPLDRRLQRLLGWGDVRTTPEDVKRACRREDKEALLQLMPRAEVLIRRGCFDLLAL